jgi:hypothetical protein
MQINILLKSGQRLQIMDASLEDYENFIKGLKSWAIWLRWNKRAVIRKSQIVFLELVPDALPKEKICASDIQEMERAKNMFNHEHFEQTI